MLAVANFVFDSTQLDELWTLDDIGYNFRHEIQVDGHHRFPKPGFHYQVRYRLTDSNGKTTVVRFQLRSYTSPSGRGREESSG
jgi:hypothetical protein